jgi:hypothetical protein
VIGVGGVFAVDTARLHASSMVPVPDRPPNRAPGNSVAAPPRAESLAAAAGNPIGCPRTV